MVNTQDIHSIRVLNYKEEPELALTITYPYPFLVGQYEDISHCQFDINHPETFSTQQKQAYNHLQDILEMIIRDFQADSPQKNLKLNLGILQVLDILVTSFLVDTVADVHKDNRLQIAERIKETFYIKSQEKILNNKKHPHCDKLECKLLNRLENALVILLFFV